MSAKKPTILIVGAGVFGSSTAYHLAKQTDADITLLDRAPFPPPQAASTDINKIIRADYTNPLYVDLAYEAIEAWKTWPVLKPHYHQTGWVMIDETGSRISEKTRQIFKSRQHDPTSDVPLTELESNDRWGGCLKGTVTNGFQNAYWNPEAGWCDAAHATAAVTTEAINSGVKYVVGELESITRDGDRVTGVRTKDGKTHAADKVVLATGAWTSAILSPLEDELDIAEENRVDKQAPAAAVAVAHYKLSDQEYQTLEAHMPVVVYGENGEVIPPPKRNQLLKFTNAHTLTHKVTTTSGHVISTPTEEDQHVVPEKLQKYTQDLMPNRVMPLYGKGREAEYWRLCWDAITPTQDWLLDKHPDSRLQNLFFAIGGSFHSYKFLPVAGKYMVNTLLGVGNGDRDAAWGWKDASLVEKPREKYEPVGDLKDFQ